LLSESNGQYIYSFTLIEPWEPQDDTPLLVANAPTSISCTVVNSKGNQLIIASDSPLPQHILQQIELCDDSTELTKRLREVLKNVDEGEATLGSKSFGLFSYNEQSAPYNPVFGRLRPHPCQLQAAQMALGGEVTYIIGPPGTGKTFTLAAIALEHLRLGRTVLIASHTNIAIDNAVMKLSDLCNDSGNSQFLQQGLVVRYGTVQKAELKESATYADVYLPKIAQRLEVSLYEQKRHLKDTLQTLDQHIAALQHSQDTEQYRQQQAKLMEKLTTLQHELEHLEQQERQRLATLRQKEDHLVRNIQGTEDAFINANRQLARMNAEREETRNALTRWHQEEQRLRTHLLEARTMSKMKRFLKGIRLEKIESSAGQALHEVYELTQKLAHLEYDFNGLLPTLAQYKQQKQSYEEALRNVRVDRDAPPKEAQRMQALKRQIARDQQAYEERRVVHEQQQQATRSHVQSILDQRVQVEQQLSILDQQLRDIEQRIVTQARIVGTTLSKCGHRLVPKSGENGAFYGCPEYVKGHFKINEDITLSHLQQIERLQNKACPRCGSTTTLHLRSRPQLVVLVCDVQCRWKQKIIFTW
jgi:AAA domain